MKKQGVARRKPSQSGKIFLAVLTFLNLVLTLALSLLRRADTIRAIQDDESIQILLKNH